MFQVGRCAAAERMLLSHVGSGKEVTAVVCGAMANPFSFFCHSTDSTRKAVGHVEQLTGASSENDTLGWDVLTRITALRNIQRLVYQQEAAAWKRDQLRILNNGIVQYA